MVGDGIGGTEKGQELEMICEMAAVELAEGVSDLNRLLFDGDIRKDTPGELKKKAEEWIDTNQDQSTRLTEVRRINEERERKIQKLEECLAEEAAEVSGNAHLHSSLQARVAALEKELADIHVNQVVEKLPLVDL